MDPLVAGLVEAERRAQRLKAAVEVSWQSIECIAAELLAAHLQHKDLESLPLKVWSDRLNTVARTLTAVAQSMR